MGHPMQSLVEPYEQEELEPVVAPENQQVDFTSLRIIATWIAQRAGIDPELGAMIDRGFVVAQVHA